MKKIICIFSILVLFGAGIPAVNALNLKNDIVDETEITATEDYEFYAGKMSIHPGDIWNGYSPKLKFDINKDFSGVTEVKREDTIVISSKWEIKADSVLFHDEEWWFNARLYLRTGIEGKNWFEYKSLWHTAEEFDYLIYDDNSGSGKLSFTLPNLDTDDNWFLNDGLVYIKVKFYIKYKRAGDAWTKEKDSDELNLIVTGNRPPKTPEKPTGPTVIKLLEGNGGTYKTIAEDPDGDKISYGFDWNGDLLVDDWSEFIESGEKYDERYIFDRDANVYEYKIRVKARDFKYHDESDWSEPIIVKIEKSRTVQKSIFSEFDILNKFFNFIEIR